MNASGNPLMGLPGWMPGRPGGNPQRLTQIADAWDTLDATLQAAERQLPPQADDISSWWRGQAANPYTTAWHDYSAGLARRWSHSWPLRPIRSLWQSTAMRSLRRSSADGTAGGLLPTCRRGSFPAPGHRHCP